MFRVLGIYNFASSKKKLMKILDFKVLLDTKNIPLFFESWFTGMKKKILSISQYELELYSLRVSELEFVIEMNFVKSEMWYYAVSVFLY